MLEDSKLETYLLTKRHWFGYILFSSNQNQFRHIFIIRTYIYHTFCCQNSSKSPSWFIFICQLELMFAFENLRLHVYKSNVPSFSRNFCFWKPVLKFTFNHNTTTTICYLYLQILMANLKITKNTHTTDNFEHQIVVAMKWWIMKRTEGKQTIFRNPPRTLKNLLFIDIRH